jgi:hypothetical protein
VRPHFLCALAFAMLGFSSSAGLFAQGVDSPVSAREPAADQPRSSSHAITGTLMDPSGAAIDDAQVDPLGFDSKPLAQVTTDNSGSFHFDNLAPAK